MNCEDRLEQLLGQAGQTISDLPEPKAKHLSMVLHTDVLEFIHDHLRMAGIIDRLEWALDNTIRERDWLRRLCEQRFTSCDLCRYGERQINVQPCASCTTFDTGDQYEFGLPEDVEAEEDRAAGEEADNGLGEG